MRHPFINLLVRWGVLALGVTLAAQIVPGISYRDGSTLLVVVLLLSFFNAILKPLLLLFTLPFILLTLGLGVLIINALLFLWVGELVKGFQVDGFWSALWGRNHRERHEPRFKQLAENVGEDVSENLRETICHASHQAREVR